MCILIVGRYVSDRWQRPVVLRTCFKLSTINKSVLLCFIMPSCHMYLLFIQKCRVLKINLSFSSEFICELILDEVSNIASSSVHALCKFLLCDVLPTSCCLLFKCLLCGFLGM